MRETFIKFFMTHAGTNQQLATIMYEMCLQMAYDENEREKYENSIDDAIALMCKKMSVDWIPLAIIMYEISYN